MTKHNYIAVFTIGFFLAGAPLGLADTVAPGGASEPFWQKIKNTFSGYYKMLTTFSRTRDADKPYYAALQRLRLEIKPKITEKCGLDIVYDHELLVHDFRNSSDFSLVRQKNEKNLAFWDADQVLTDTNHIYERQLLYRAFLKYDFENSRLTLGKQLIDWGRMRFYSPLDLFNQPLSWDIETDERVGFDAVNYEFFGGDFWGLSALYGPERNSAETSFGLRFTTKVGTYDAFVIAAKHEKEKIAGFGWDGYAGDAGFRGEFTYAKNGRDAYARAAVGCDYNFWRRFYAIIEYFYNGAADGDYDAFANSLTEARKRLSLEKNLISFSVVHELTPLLKLKGAMIYDADGKSAFFNPELRYNVKENLDVTVGSQMFVETKDTEFQDQNNVYYVELKVFF